jgi:hypothetical protein
MLVWDSLPYVKISFLLLLIGQRRAAALTYDCASIPANHVALFHFVRRYKYSGTASIAEQVLLVAKIHVYVINLVLQSVGIIVLS